MHWASQAPGMPTSVIVDSKITQANVQGQVTSEIMAEKITQYADPEKTELANAHLFMYGEAEQPWQIMANHVLLTANNERADLTGNVKLYRAATADQEETTVMSEQFTWWPQQQFGETDKFITLLQPGLTVTSVGAAVDAAQGEIDLLAEVEVVYEPAFD